jgi:hypothetical protein
MYNHEVYQGNQQEQDRLVSSESGEIIDFLGKQVFLIDPRSQGFGLQAYEFLDGYANKFFILSGKDGLFISP